MMTQQSDDYYRVLELEPGASSEEIKKAYFRLVRKYTPEKNPDMFQKIRQAYDALKDDPLAEQGEIFDRPNHPIALYFLNNAQESMRNRDYEEACRTLAEALKIEPDQPFLLLLQAEAQMHAGHSQNAAKAAEKLIQILPESRNAWTIYANGLYGRGWYKKALPAFRKAFSLGSRSYEFLTDYAGAAYNNQEREESLRILAIIQSGEKWEAGNLFLGINAFNIQTAFDLFSPKSLESFLERYVAFIKRNRRLLDDPDLAMTPLNGLEHADEQNVTFSHSSMMKILTALDKVIEIKPEWESATIKPRCSLTCTAMERDPDLNFAWGALMACLFPDEEDQEQFNLLAVDTKLWLLEHEPNLLKQAEIVKARYPFVAQGHASYFEKLASGDLEKLRRDLSWEYKKLAGKKHITEEKGWVTESWVKYRQEGIDEMMEEEKLEWDGEEEPGMPYEPMEPIVRENEKIGRNDPCPCGSGKKFKRCCMGKGIYD